MKYVFVDTDIFVRHLRYERDQNYFSNEQFIHLLKSKKINSATSIYNVLETLGVLSFNTSSDVLKEMYENFCSNYQIKVLAKMSASGDWVYSLEEVFRCISQKQSLGDAFVSSIVEGFSHQLSAFVSWNAKHFKALSVPVMTPKEFLKANNIKVIHSRPSKTHQ